MTDGNATKIAASVECGFSNHLNFDSISVAIDQWLIIIYHHRQPITTMLTLVINASDSFSLLPKYVKSWQAAIKTNSIL